jgi:hypothetical protein
MAICYEGGWVMSNVVAVVGYAWLSNRSGEEYPDEEERMVKAERYNV